MRIERGGSRFRRSESQREKIASDDAGGGRPCYSRRYLLDRLNQTELRERLNAVVQTNFFGDLAILDP